MTTHLPQMSGAEIRQAFIDYFMQRGHTFVPSSSLVIADDPTLLFANSGMVQFKNVFLGTDKRPYSRAVNSQKCMRVSGKHNDLEDVGRDDTHHTFFEMLGNWSFGDYYKADAITWAWDFLTNVLGLPAERLYATVFRDEQGVIPADDEAAQLWLQQPNFQPSHLLYLGRKSNLWEMADRGPCGPCSEIHIDLGAVLGPIHDPVTEADLDSLRFLELWNLVFMQYNRTGETTFEPLPAQHVDTGMGLERVVAVMQGVLSNYQSDLFTPIMDTIQRLINHNDAERQANLTPYRVIADHSRAAAFLIADGVVPGNTGRNYIVRMIIRRAYRFGRKIGFQQPFLAQVAETVIAEYQDAYPELARSRVAIQRQIMLEEQRFQRTLDSGLTQLQALAEKMQAAGETKLSGKVAFDLYATYGMPLEITRDELRDEFGLRVDELGFQQAMSEHRKVSGGGQAMGVAQNEQAALYNEILTDLQAQGWLLEGVEHKPYGLLETQETVLAILHNGQLVANAQVGQTVEVILTGTPFYVSSGGQVSDGGVLVCYSNVHDNGQAQPLWQIRVTEMSKPVSGLIVHTGEVLHGIATAGDNVWAMVDDVRRWDIMRNHTATHLLHAELRATLGEHVRQSGSLVAPDRLRFDFAHNTMLTQTELATITTGVNNAILTNYPVKIDFQSRTEAITQGAMALFGEKYGEVVRTVKIGEPTVISFELCGGTHVPQTADIGAFVILSEGAVAAGVRRVEALTGRAAQAYIQKQLQIVNTAAAYLNVKPAELDRKVLAVLEENTNLQKQLAKEKLQTALHKLQELLASTPTQAGKVLLTAQLAVDSADLLRQVAEAFRQQVVSGAAVLTTVVQGKPQIAVVVSADLVAQGCNAGQIIKELAGIVGGGGGGKPNFAQAGGKDANRLPAALQRAREILAQC